MNNNIYFRFERQPLGEKTIDNVPGIDPLIEEEFNKFGFTKAYQLLGQYLLCNKNNEQFNNWLETTIPSMTPYNRHDCINALSEWVHNNL
jgi:hypothetical protein